MRSKFAFRLVRAGASALCVSGFTGVVQAGTGLDVIAVTPAQHEGNVATAATVSITFDQPVNPATVNPASVRVFGRWTGAVTGAIAFSNLNQTITITPSRPFFAGDVVFVNLSEAIESAGGAGLRSGGWSHRFTTRAARATREFSVIGTLTSVDPDDDISPRPYGGQASDVNEDGWPDLVLVCEDTSDVRIFVNRADGSGLFEDFHDLPTVPISVNAVPSPNEPQDFNNDGHSDLATCNTATASVSIALGNGDGTFGPSQTVGVGTAPHGLAVLDIDGDGDHDLATANTGSGNVSIVRNNGAGVFGSVTSFDGGGSGEYGLSAADMDNDGIDDLVVGARFSEQIIVHLGNGDGTFSAQPATSAGGRVWMLVPADVNGDGLMDVSTSNSESNSGSILLGTGGGGLSAPDVEPTAAQALAFDLADMDGDGDMDWLLSSFTGSEYRMFVNDGAGGFSFDQQWDAVSNPACAVLLDFDNDGDMDIAQIDEIADTITLLRNRGPLPAGDVNGDCTTDTADLGILLAAFGSGDDGADVNGDGVVDTADLGILLAAFGDDCP